MPVRPASSTCMALMKPCPGLAQQRVGRHPALLEHDLRGVAGAQAELVLLLARRHARRAARDDEGRDAPVALAAIGHGHGHHHAADTPMRRERLGPVQHPVVAVADRRGPRARGIAAGGRLGQSPGAERLAPGQRHEKPLLLGLGPEHVDVRRAQTVVRRHERGRPTGRPAPLPRCRCSSRRPTSRRRHTPRGTGCPAGPVPPAWGSARAGRPGPRPIP